MFGAVAGFGEVGVGVFEDWVLVTMTELLGQTGVSVMVVFFAFGCTFAAIGIIIGNLCHEFSLSQFQRRFPRISLRSDG